MFNKLSTGLSRLRGGHFENRALAFLKKRGLSLVTRNFHSRYGEIDLIMRDGDTLVFVEVRYRATSSHGNATETVNYYKQRKLINTAQFFLQRHSLTDKIGCRFDVVGITGEGKAMQFQWIKNAFSGTPAT